MELNDKIKDLHRKLKMTEEECDALNSRTQELEVIVESMNYLKDEIDLEREKHRTKEKETHNLQQRHREEIEKLQCIIQSQNEATVKMILKEKEWEKKMKDIDKFKSTIKSLEQSNYDQSMLINKLDSALACKGHYNRIDGIRRKIKQNDR